MKYAAEKTDTIPALAISIEEVVKPIANSQILPSGLVKRAKIILLASQGITNQEISKEVGLHYSNAAVWRKRFLQALPTLKEVEAKTPDELEKKIKLVLSDKKRITSNCFYSRAGSENRQSCLL